MYLQIKKTLLSLLLTPIVLSGCGELGESISGGGSGRTATAEELIPQIAPHVPGEKDREFFAKEASQVGVVNIRYMTPEEQEIMTFLGPGPCGLAIYSQSTIAMNPNCQRARVRTMAHEISHFGSRSTCTGSGGGHGPPFWEYFRGVAARYVEEVGSGSWINPFGSIASSEEFYQSYGEARCKDVIN